ncbi:MAG: hypothetical protein WA208_21195, partial [Thermoanaerobaculia bacterium]
MAITLSGTVYSTTWLEANGGDAVVRPWGWVYDSVNDKLYLSGMYNNINNPAWYKWRVISDLSTAPAGADWTLSSTPTPALASGDILNEGGNGMALAGDYIYFLQFRGSDTGAAAQRVNLTRIAVGTGVVEYAAEQFKISDAAYSFKGPARGFAVVGSVCYVVLWDVSGATWKLVTWSIAGLTWQASSPSNSQAVAGMVAATASRTLTLYVADGSFPAGMTLTNDGNLTVWYDAANKVEKYAPADLAYIGFGDWTSGANVGSMYYDGSNLWELDRSIATGADHTVYVVGYTDGSSAVIDESRCSVELEARPALVGEVTPLAITVTLRDGFGSPMASL